jgi:polyhydroxyalkanoate synthesis regulator phasin
MDRKRFITLFMVSSIGMVSGVMAATIQERVDMAQRRIEHGIRSGALTREEGHRLRDEFDRVRRDEARARSDGHLDRRERERLNQDLTRLERHIARFKNNDSTRRDGGGRRY